MRKLLIAGNWKMYKTPSEAQSFLNTFLPLVKGLTQNEIVICPSRRRSGAGGREGKGFASCRGRAEHAF